MIESLYGQIKHSSPGLVVLDVAGVGYAINVPLLYKRDAAVSLRLHIIDQWRLNGSMLERKMFGFEDSEMRDMVVLMADKVHKVGVSMASKVFNHMSLIEFKQAVSAGDTAALKACKGIGPKAAEGIVTELQTHLGLESNMQYARNQKEAYDAAAAMVVLGYKKQDAMEAVTRIVNAHDCDLTTEQIIKLAMKK